MGLLCPLEAFAVPIPPPKGRAEFLEHELRDATERQEVDAAHTAKVFQGRVRTLNDENTKLSEQCEHLTERLRDASSNLSKLQGIEDQYDALKQRLHGDAETSENGIRALNNENTKLLSQKEQIVKQLQHAERQLELAAEDKKEHIKRSENAEAELIEKET